MRRALFLAYSRLGYVSPNPSVGAVIVREGKIVSEGVTQKPGGNHAEIEALQNCDDSRGATLYVTLEPCCHTTKRTAPCTGALVKAGIKKVFIGVLDQNPAVSGKGVKALRDAGVEVVVGVLEEEARRAHEFFFRWITKKVPFVTVKAALTLDGKMTWGDEKSKHITGKEALEKSHVLRRMHDAILVGVNTIIRDDPQLTCRLVSGRNPLRVVLDSRLRISPEARIFREEGKTLLFCTQQHDKKKMRELLGKAQIVVVKDKDGHIDLADALHMLGDLGITSVLVEGGPEVITSFLREKWVQKGVFFISPKKIKWGRGFFEGMREEDLMLRRIEASMMGKDMMIEGYFHEN